MNRREMRDERVRLHHRDTVNAAILRHRSDFLSVVVAVAAFAYQLVACLVAAPLLFLLPVPLLSNWIHLVEHNHVHVPVFRSKRANEVFSWVLSLGTGIPVEGYRYHHVEVHHRYSGTARDWTSPFAYRRSRFPDRPVRLPWYVATYMARAWRRGVPVMWQRRGTEQGMRFWRSIVVMAATSTALGIAQPRSFLLFFVVPWLGNALAPALMNWRHHRGCDHATKFTSANVNLGVFSRTLGFNIGYHSVHHAHPGLHWSRLPQRFIAEFAQSTPRQRFIAATQTRLARAGVHEGKSAQRLPH